jgi:hypothetical protein
MQTRNTEGLDLSPEGYRDRLDQLLAHWDSLNVSQPSLRGRPGVTPDRALTIWGLTAHAHALARIVRQLGTRGIELAPLVRTAFECAVDAQWIITRGPEALPAFLNEGARQRVNLGKAMRGAGWAGMDEKFVDALESERLPKGSLDEQARHIEKITNDFVIGRDLYTVYRLLCSVSHASNTVVNAYQRDDPASPLGFSLRATAGSIGVGSWEWVLVWTLVWAGRALDWVSDGSPSRHVYKRIARASGMPDAVLALSEPARAAAFADHHWASKRSRPR